MKSLVPIFLLMISNTSFSQSEHEANEALGTISLLEQVDSLQQAQPEWYIVVNKTLPVGFTYDSLLYNSNVGQIIRTQISDKSPKFAHKVIEKGTEEVCKVKYIYLDGNNHDSSEIKKLRKQIIAQYNDGIPFLALVQKYNEDGNPTGELDWFYKGMMVDDFDQAVREKNAGEIFTVDVTKNNWYYVVFKSEENKTLECTYSIGIKIDK